MDLSFLFNASLGELSFSEAWSTWEPSVTFVIGVTIYSIFVFRFYRFLAKKDIFSLNIKERDTHPHVKKILYVVKYIILFPLVAFFWFLILAVLLMVIVESATMENILFVSVAVVSAVRIAAYYHEDLSKELAKLLPFALLALFIIDASHLSFSSPWKLIRQLPGMWETLIYYLLFVIMLELALRIIVGIKHIAIGKKSKSKEKTEKHEESPEKPKNIPPPPEP